MMRLGKFLIFLKYSMVFKINWLGLFRKKIGGIFAFLIIIIFLISQFTNLITLLSWLVII